MRKIIESTLISLDGVFSDPHTWAMKYFDQEAERHALDLVLGADAMLMGRRTYEFFSAAFPHQTGDYGARINGMRKYVFSNSLAKVDWNNSVLISGDVVAEAARLRQQEGKDLVIYGHGRLARTLLAHNLLDEFKFWIHPVLLGNGTLLFHEGERAELKLVGTKSLASDVLVATYRRASA
jgi:dihydrofolate reductase